MKTKLFSTVLALALVFAITTVAFAGAYDTSFTTSITYQNVGDAATTNLQIHFYEGAGDTEATVITRPNLAAGAGTSLFIGSLSEIGADFKGSAVMSSDQALVATLVQLPQGSTTVKNRPLSNGFKGTEGGEQSLIASVLKNTYDTTTRFSVQNIGGDAVDVAIAFYNTSATKVHTVNATIEGGAAYLVDAGDIDELGTSFNGSAVVSAPGGSVVSTALELEIAGVGAKAFEGVATGSDTYYMPSALCKAYGSDTAYAVQNTSLTEKTDVTVTYSNGATEKKTIGAGAKASFIACDATGMKENYSGAAIITSDTTPIIAIGKAYGSGLATAFVGASSGAQYLALPYVRYATDADFVAGLGQRTFITIQNIGDADLAAGTVKVDYIDKNGTVVGTHTLGAIAEGGKLNSNASNAGLTEFGKYADGSYGGGAIVYGPAGAELAVVGRVSTQTGPSAYVSEDYNGIAITSYTP
jgi:hypothetical protein